MTSSSARPQKAFVWIWLPGNTEPIVAGLNVAPVRLERAAKKDVLLIERFDRAKTPEGWIRRSMISALTLLRLDEMMGRYASYESLADIIRAEFHDASCTLCELFGRMVFNVLSGNTDDYARNHVALWDGVCKLARLNEADRNRLWGRQFFNPYVFEDLIQKDDVKLAQLAATVVEAGA